MSERPAPETVVAWRALVRTSLALTERVEEDLKRAGYPPLEWYDVLYELDRSDGGWLRQSEVNTRTLLAQYNLSRLIDRLARESLVERRQCPVDGRNNVLVITDKGRALRASMWPVYAAAIEAHLGARLTPTEAADLARILGGLLDGARAPSSGATGCE